MGFWGKLGKYALKAAPYAAMAIPGVGVPLGMAISGGLAAANKKASGGSWKDALISGGIDAGLAGVGGSVIKGLGPSNPGSFIAKDVAKTAGKGGFKSALGGFAKDNWQDILGSAMDKGKGNLGNSAGNPPGTMNYAGEAVPRNDPELGGFTQRMRQQLGPVMGQENQNNPNLALALGEGRMQAMNQGRRRRAY